MNKKLVGGVVAVIAIAALVVTGIAMQKDNTPSTGTSDSSDTADSENIQGGQHANLPEDEGTDAGSSDEGVALTDEVEIEDFGFTPASIKVKKGTTVTWTNKDSAPHTVTGVDSNKGPESGTMNKNDTYTFTFDEVGTFGYICDFHPSMKGEVTVTE